MSVKVAVCGAGGVGKSCLTIQFIHQKFVETYDPTIEDSYKKSVVVGNPPKTYMLEIVDTAGQEEFATMRETYMKEAQGFFLVYSVIDKRSLEDLQEFFKQIHRVHEDKKMPIVVCGNKNDLESDKVVTLKSAEETVKKFNEGTDCPVFEVSAKTKLNVDNSFLKLVELVVEEGQANPSKSSGEKKKRGCNLL